MIKRLSKAKKSKQGAILVIVVLILALAMIFIAAAMMLTQATRGRMYENTLKSQARLTVTAASEVFLEALETQEITDAQLDSMISASKHDNDSDKIKMVVSGVPGMSEDDDNCTYLDLYYVGGNKKIAYADFTTVIGDESENVQIKLRVKETGGAQKELFKNQIDIGGGAGSYNVRFTQGIGMYNPTVTPVNNNIVFRGAATEDCSSTVVYSNIVFAEGAVCRLGGGNKYFGDLICVDSYLSTRDGGVDFYGDYFLIGKNKDDGALLAESANGWDKFTGSFVFAGRDFQNPSGTGDNCNKLRDTIANESNNSIYFVGNTNKTISHTDPNNTGSTYNIRNKAVADDGTYVGLTSTLQEKYNTYSNYDYSTSNDPFPSSISVVFSQYNPGGTDDTMIINAGTKTAREEYSCIKKVVNGKTSYEYKTYPANYTFTENTEVYREPLSRKFPTKDYFHNGDGTLNAAAYHEYYDDSDELYDWVKISCSKTGLEAADGKKVIQDGTTHVVDCDGTKNNVIDLNPGWYQFTAGEADFGTTPFIICLDGSRASEYRLFFKSGDYNFKSVVFAVYNAKNTGDATSNVTIVLEPSATVHFGYTNNRDTSCLCIGGFISVSRDKSSAAGIAKYIKDGPRPTVDGGEAIQWKDKNGNNYQTRDGANIKYSKYYDSKAKPCVYVLGSDCRLSMNSSTICEAYIGLYQSYAGTSGSTFGGDEGQLDGAWPVYIYGRVEANKFDMGNSQECVCMPYCPSAGGGSSTPAKRLAETKYEVVDIIYYYN